MCKRNSPDKYEASTGSVRETPGQVKNKASRHRMCTIKKKKSGGGGGEKEKNPARDV